MHVVTIDFWNTLFDSSNGELRRTARRRVLYEELEQLGHKVNDAIVTQGYQEAMAYFNTVWRVEQRTPSTRAVVEHFWQQLGIAPGEEVLQRVVQEFSNGVLVHPPALLPGAREALAELSGLYYLGLVSDTAFSPGSVLQQLMEREGILKFFTALSFSDETGVAKPHPKAFHAAIQAAGVQPEQCVHIGDIEGTDIAGAKALGMKAIRFVGDNDPFVGNGHDEPTAADAEAVSWNNIPDIIRAMSGR